MRKPKTIFSLFFLFSASLFTPNTLTYKAQAQTTDYCTYRSQFNVFNSGAGCKNLVQGAGYIYVSCNNYLNGTGIPGGAISWHAETSLDPQFGNTNNDLMTYLQLNVRIDGVLQPITYIYPSSNTNSGIDYGPTSDIGPSPGAINVIGYNPAHASISGYVKQASGAITPVAIRATCQSAG